MRRPLTFAGGDLTRAGLDPATLRAAGWATLLPLAAVGSYGFRAAGPPGVEAAVAAHAALAFVASLPAANGAAAARSRLHDPLLILAEPNAVRRSLNLTVPRLLSAALTVAIAGPLFVLCSRAGGLFPAEALTLWATAALVAVTAAAVAFAAAAFLPNAAAAATAATLVYLAWRSPAWSPWPLKQLASAVRSHSPLPTGVMLAWATGATALAAASACLPAFRRSRRAARRSAKVGRLSPHLWKGLQFHYGGPRGMAVAVLAVGGGWLWRDGFGAFLAAALWLPAAMAVAAARRVRMEVDADGLGLLLLTPPSTGSIAEETRFPRRLCRLTGILAVAGLAFASESGRPVWVSADAVAATAVAACLAGDVADLIAAVLATRLSVVPAAVAAWLVVVATAASFVAAASVTGLAWTALIMTVYAVFHFRGTPLPVPFLPRSRFLRQFIRGSSELDPYRAQAGVGGPDRTLGRAYLPEFGRWRDAETGGDATERTAPVMRLAENSNPPSAVGLRAAGGEDGG